jgi:tetratricopeptide (TPR) repeat protein
MYEWDWAATEREFKRALDLNPSDAEAHHQYSHYLNTVGRTHESLVESLRALELDPLSLPLNAHLAWHYLYARQYDQAIEQCRKTIEMDANYPPAHGFLALAYEQKGMHQEAIAEFQKTIALLGEDSVQTKAELGHAYAVAGKKEQALKIMDELKALSKETYVSPYDVAMIYVGLDQKDQAFDWLQKGYEERFGMRYLKVDPRLDPLRSDPRFRDLVRRVGLPQ